MEPFKIKTVEPINLPTREERLQAAKKAGYNLFRIPSRKVTIDFLTDSGTGALSEEQWAMLMKGDESYAGAESWQRFEKAVREFAGKRHVIPVHQGRAAEKILAELLVKSRGGYAISNTFFDTTRANFEHAGATCLDFPASDNLSSWQKFKGNLHIKAAEKFLKKNGPRTRALVMTLTNNADGGQPVSLKNVRGTAGLAKKYRIPLIIDACRIAENAYFIKTAEKEWAKAGINFIIRKTLSYADVLFMSAKKDGLANIGGFIATNNGGLAEALKTLAILYEGFATYGGMSGREMETVAQGLKEVTDEKYLAYRIGQVAYLHRGLSKIGFSLINPPGGHAVYIDAAKALPRIKKGNFPAHALAIAFYLEGGVRGVEIGSLMFGDSARHELVRLALPRRVYTKSHLDYVIETAKRVWEKRKALSGFKVVKAPKTLRHFSAVLRPV
ncbi:MAG: tryptophanase [Parcubacteria group bacterium]|nr:tryptophanase [Parcubacteria group bacterium]